MKAHCIKWIKLKTKKCICVESVPSHRAGLEPGTPVRELKAIASSISRWGQGSEVYTQPLLAYIRYTCFYSITRWHRCSISTTRVINKMNIGPRFEYFMSKCLVFPTLFHSSAHHTLKLIKSQRVIHVTAAERARERRGSAHRASLMALFHCMVRFGTARYGTAQFGSVCISTAV